MDNNQLQYIKIQSQYADKVEQFEKCVVKAAKLTHAIADTAEKKCKQARMAIESGNIDCTGVEDELDVTMAQRTELDYLIYNDPLGYADLILNGDPEKYLKNVAGSHGLED